MFPDVKWTAVVASDLRVGGKWSVEMREPSLPLESVGPWSFLA